MIAQASPAAGPLRTDPSKRVNYTLGLVLGVDEFQQDQLYHAAARRGHDRLLHGYGTVWGLAFAPYGRRLAVGRSDGGLAVWDLEGVRARLAEFGADVPEPSRPTDSPVPPAPIDFDRLARSNRARAGAEEAEQRAGRPIAVVADLQGPKLRLGSLPADGFDKVFQGLLRWLGHFPEH